MNFTLRSFLPRLLVFSFFCAGISLAWQQYASPRFQTDMVWAIFAFFVLVTSAIHMILMRAAAESPRKFVVMFMAITGLKLFGYLIILLIYAFLKREAALGFILFFLVMYFLYTAFEVITLLKHFKK